MIKTTSTGAANLLENLLLWARSQSGAMEIHAIACDLKAIVEENISVLKINADKKKIRILNEVDAKAKVIADKNMLTTVIRNLLNNAIKFTSEDGEVRFDFYKDGNQGFLNIKDNGVGIEEKKVKRLFRVSENISTKGTSGESGTGLGLIVCMEFISKNNGQLLVESEKGKGSTFTIKLPLDSGESTDTEKHDVAQNENKKMEIPPIEETILTKELPLKNIDEAVVLLIDDESSIHEYITLHFRGKYQFHTAEDGKQGFEKAIRILPDLIISDVMMPEMEGTELCQQLKNDTRTSHIPIILLTAKGSELSQIEGINTGADDYIMKPFNADILEAKAISLIDNRRKLRNKFIRDITLSPKEVTVNDLDRIFLEKAIQIIENHIDDIEFDITRFTKEIGMSRTLLHNKLKALTGKSSTEFVRSIRLRKALQIIKSGEVNITDVHLMVGFNSRPYFYKCFTEQFGKNPGEFKK